MGTLFLIFAIVLILSCVPLVFVVVRNYARFRGPRVVVCPETVTPEGVEVGAVRAAWTAARGDTQFRLTSCSRWRERADCSQRCLTQIEEAPDGCLVRARVARWYEGATCALCKSAIGEIRRSGRSPGLVGPDRKIRKWRDLTVEDLAEAFATHQPVCLDCCALPGLGAKDVLPPSRRPPASHSGSAA